MVTSDGQKYKEITSVQPFSSYEDAQAYVAAQTSGNYRIVSYDPFISPVPIEALNSYELVYSSGDTTSQTTVKIFEYLGSSESWVSNTGGRARFPAIIQLGNCWSTGSEYLEVIF